MNTKTNNRPAPAAGTFGLRTVVTAADGTETIKGTYLDKWDVDVEVAAYHVAAAGRYYNDTVIEATYTNHHDAQMHTHRTGGTIYVQATDGSFPYLQPHDSSGLV